MANPTFDGTDLTDKAAQNIIGSRRVRTFMESLPGANGLYAQMHGTGGRAIRVVGFLTSSGNTASNARNQAFTDFATLEALVDGITIADFVATDGTTYTNCILQTAAHGPIRITGSKNPFVAYTSMTYTLLQLVP